MRNPLLFRLCSIKGRDGQDVWVSHKNKIDYAASYYFKHPPTVKNPIGATKSTFEE
jgi:hypothetical protein